MVRFQQILCMSVLLSSHSCSIFFICRRNCEADIVLFEEGWGRGVDGINLKLVVTLLTDNLPQERMGKGKGGAERK